MGTIMLVIGAGMLAGSAVLLYFFFAHPGLGVPEGFSRLEMADFPQISGLLEGAVMFAFGSFLFIFGMAWVISGGGTG